MHAAHAKRGPAKHGKGNAIACAGMAVKDHRNGHNQIAQKNNPEGFWPAQAVGNHVGGQHISGNADRHADPEGGNMPGVPVPLGKARRAQIGVAEFWIQVIRIA